MEVNISVDGSSVIVNCKGQGTRDELIEAYGSKGFGLTDERTKMLTTGEGINRVQHIPLKRQHRL